jgi:hypothetical protein
VAPWDLAERSYEWTFMAEVAQAAEQYGDEEREKRATHK